MAITCHDETTPISNVNMSSENIFIIIGESLEKGNSQGRQIVTPAKPDEV
jgi:hypothetical protein